jgi:predicted secreted protein
MASASVISYAKFVLLLERPSLVGTFSAACGMNERSLQISKSLNDVNVPDCTNEDAPSWVGRDVVSQSWSVSGQGVLAEEADAVWEEFLFGTISWNVQIKKIFAGARGTRTMVGKAHLSDFTYGATRGGKVTVNLSLQSDGALTVS